MLPNSCRPNSRAGSALGMLMSGVIASLFPNFQVFTLADSLAAADLPAGGTVLQVVLYAGGYVAVVCALAIFTFRRREI